MTEEVGSSEVISAIGLTKRFGALVALDHVDLSIRAGESVTLFGPNGAGKTTLIRILTLGLRLDDGRLSIAGFDPRKHDIEIRRRIGVISHHSFLYDDLSAGQNLEFYAKLYGVADPAARSRELLELMGLAHREEDRVGDLSRGLQQRVSVARSLVHDPPLLFLDEPFTGLDPQAADRLRALLGRLREEGRTVILVTHDLRQGIELGDRWILLSRGRIVDQGSTADVDPGRFEEEYSARLSAPRNEGARR